MRTANNSWAESHDNALRVAIEQRCTFSQAAAVLNDLFQTNYTRSAVGGRCMRLGLKSKNVEGRAKGEKRAKPSKPAKSPTVTAKPVKPMPRKQQFVAEPITGLRDVDVIPLNIPLIDLKPDQCRWPYGEGPFVFCGCQVFGGSSYCEPHLSLSQGRGTESERRAHERVSA